MDSVSYLLHLVLSFLLGAATLIVNFMISMLQLLLQFIRTIVGSAQ
jgi:hypothetical protein